MNIKSILFATLLTSTLISPLMAEDSTGCGLGWKVTKSYTTSAATTRASTNATSSNTFGMTSGTSGCAQHSLVKNDKMELHFIEGNYDFVVADAAAGSGEYITGLARTLGCNDSVSDYFSTQTQQDFNTIFIENKGYLNSLRQIKKMIRSNKILNTQCGHNS